MLLKNLYSISTSYVSAINTQQKSSATWQISYHEFT